MTAANPHTGLGGIMDLTGAAEGEPQKIGVAFAGIFTGVYGTVGVLAAPRRRDTTGQGGHVDIALLEIQVSALANQAMNYLVSGRAPTRMGNAHPNIVPYQIFPVSDGHVIVLVGNDGQFGRFARVLDAPALAADPRFTTNSLQAANRAVLVPLLTALTITWTNAALLAALQEAGVPCGPINTVADVFADPQVIARGLGVDLPHPEAEGGTAPGVASPIVLDSAWMVSPRLGADTEAVLSDGDWVFGPSFWAKPT